MRLLPLAFLLLGAAILLPASALATGCERTAYYDRCALEEGPVCEEITVYLDHAEWRHCTRLPPPPGLAPPDAGDLVRVDCSEDCHVYLLDEEALCLNTQQSWWLHEPIVCRPIS